MVYQAPEPLDRMSNPASALAVATAAITGAVLFLLARDEAKRRRLLQQT